MSEEKQVMQVGTETAPGPIPDQPVATLDLTIPHQDGAPDLSHQWGLLFLQLAERGVRGTLPPGTVVRAELDKDGVWRISCMQHITEPIVLEFRLGSGGEK